MIKAIGFDADDTLWHNEIIFQDSQRKLKKILKNYSLDGIDEKLFKIEKGNLKLYGFGIKGFILSMIETSIKISNQKVNSKQIRKIMNLGNEMLSGQIFLLKNVESTLKYLSKKYILLLITKGDLLEQETKIQNSGLSKYFKYINIVSEKNELTYTNILKNLNIDPKLFLMVGNSLKSDIIPVIRIGANAIHIPYKITWEYEMEHNEINPNQYSKIKNLGLLKSCLNNINKGL